LGRAAWWNLDLLYAHATNPAVCVVHQSNQNESLHNNQQRPQNHNGNDSRAESLCRDNRDCREADACSRGDNPGKTTPKKRMRCHDVILTMEIDRCETTQATSDRSGSGEIRLS
jgi:hypothetical protein